ncbi:MAG TPA: hypothetical protein VLB68_05830 [Pyrinomonadaceae bacterium]|nr:hypothetical protein [Pyrinomonadaceae bacterium]
MSSRPCRDCGYLLEPERRGCPRCARNIEAENMIEKYFWLAFVPLVLILIAVMVYLLR